MTMTRRDILSAFAGLAAAPLLGASARGGDTHLYTTHATGSVSGPPASCTDRSLLGTLSS